MKDTDFIRDDGSRIPVGKMTNSEILEILQDGCEVIDTTPDNVRERLKIELLIRELGL